VVRPVRALLVGALLPRAHRPLGVRRARVARDRDELRVRLGLQLDRHPRRHDRRRQVRHAVFTAACPV
jgi:hypothetical protein